jgi:signal peptidase II
MAAVTLPNSIPAPHARRRLYFVIAFCVLLLDQFTKWLVDKNLSLHDSISIVPGIFNLTHVENQGAAFGLFADSPAEWRAATLIIFSAIALVVVSVLLWRNSHSFTTGGVALALILGGAIGNLADRVFQGHVVDFLDFYVSTHHWPAFNVADSAIVVGALLLVSEILFAGAPQETASALRSS